MITRIKISRSATGTLTANAAKYQGSYHASLTPNIILRNALMFSIANDDKLTDEVLDNGGTEFQISTLLGADSDIYFSLINHYYGKQLEDEKMKSVICFHIEKGLKNKGFKEVF
jgi:DNA sulfur modification protein DndE